MLNPLICRAIEQYKSFLLFGDRLHWIGEQTDRDDNCLVQKLNGSKIKYSLSSGIPIKDLEDINALASREEIRKEKDRFIEHHLERDNVSEFDYINRCNLLRFVVDEIFPRMIASSVEERVDAILNRGKKLKTGKEILEEGLGDDIKVTKKTIEVKTHTLERLELQEPRRFLETISDMVSVEGEYGAISTVETPSAYSGFSKNIPVIVLGGKIYLCTKPYDECDMEIHIGEHSLGYEPEPLDHKRFKDFYTRHEANEIKKQSIEELKVRLQEMDKAILRDVDYMPLADLDEFRFRDVGFFRNKDLYYIFKKIPKFARQTHYDEDLFLAKEFDSDGYGGELAVGIRVTPSGFEYLEYELQCGGVVYRGPIKEDAPFHGTVQLTDPVMRQKYGELRTICHIGGYPEFSKDADGFVQCFHYAENNFLDSFRQRFVEYHYDAEQQVQMMEAGKLLTKADAKKKGFMLTNIHKVEK